MKVALKREDYLNESNDLVDLDDVHLKISATHCMFFIFRWWWTTKYGEIWIIKKLTGKLALSPMCLFLNSNWAFFKQQRSQQVSSRCPHTPMIGNQMRQLCSVWSLVCVCVSVVCLFRKVEQYCAFLALWTPPPLFILFLGGGRSGVIPFPKLAFISLISVTWRAGATQSHTLMSFGYTAEARDHVTMESKQ